MANQVYLALYKGRKTGKNVKAWAARFADWLIRKCTHGQYSHCEIAILVKEQSKQYLFGNTSTAQYACYSSSLRDGGVRQKTMLLDSDKWDLIELTDIKAAQIIDYFSQTKDSRYDWFGAIGVVFGISQVRSKFFCSEWCMNAINGDNEGWRFSPNDLAAIFKKNYLI